MAFWASVCQATILSMLWDNFRSRGLEDTYVMNWALENKLRLLEWEAIGLWPLFFAVSAWFFYKLVQKWFPRVSDFKKDRNMGVLANWMLKTDKDAA